MKPDIKGYPFAKVRLSPIEFKSLPTHPPGWYPQPVAFSAWKALCHYVTPGRKRSWLIGVYTLSQAELDKLPDSATLRANATVWFKPVIVLGKPPVPFWFQNVYQALLAEQAAAHG